jgi:integrase
VFGGVQHQLRKLDENGYTPRVIRHLQSARAITTNQNYRSKWSLFEAYARNKFDPHSASPAQLAEFLTHIFETRGLTATTIKGYRAAIGHVLRLANGYDPGDDRIIQQLIRSFERQRPTLRSDTPNWDVSLVIDQWGQTENAELPLKLLQTKAIFLLALATGARRGELWALTSDVGMTGDSPPTLVIPFDKSFVFKTQFTTKNRSFPRNVVVQPFETAGPNELCPVQTVQTFLSRSAKLRQANQSSLFIPFREGAVRPTKQLISANVVKAITWAYKQAQMEPPKTVRAHDVRGVATSLSYAVGTSMDDVLRAGRWSNPHTFLKHYAKQIEPLTRQRLKRVPHVACAGRIIDTDCL